MMCFKEISRIPSPPQYLSPVWTLRITRMWNGFSHFVSDLGDGGEHMKMKKAYSLVQNVELSHTLCTGFSYSGIYLGNWFGSWLWNKVCLSAWWRTRLLKPGSQWHMTG